jgi:hypothetical protein
MENILWDMIQADQFSAMYLVKDSAHLNIKTENLRLYQEVFRLHQVSREDFRKSFQYYQDRPDLIKTVFDSLLSRGNRLRTESYNKPAPPPVSSPAIIPPAKGSPASPLPVKLPGQGPARKPFVAPNHRRDSSNQKGKLPVR